MHFFFKSTNGGTSWTKSFYWTGYPNAKFKYTIDMVYPWLNWGVTSPRWPDVVNPKLGWMISGLAINPFNSNEIMYGTGATVYGTSNFGDWGNDSTKKVIFKSVADGIEECAVLALAVPPVTSGTGSNVKLLSGVGDVGGFAHTDLQKPTQMFLTPRFTNTTSIDYAELDPKQVVRVGTSSLDLYEQFCNIGISNDGGLTWNKLNVTYDSTYNSGSVAMSARGENLLWAPSGKIPVCGSFYGLKQTNLPADVRIASDRTDTVYYALKDSVFYTGYGATFNASTKKFPFATAKMKAVPGLKGHVWFPAEKSGLWYTTDGGTTLELIDTTVVQSADVIGFGKAAQGANYPAIYITGKVSGKTGIFQSIDKGATWKRINDDQHQYGSINYAITGDMRQYGIVFVGTNGRGVVYGDVSGTSSLTSNIKLKYSSRKIIRTGSIVSIFSTENLNLFDLRGTLLRTGRSDGKQARVKLAGLAKGLYVARCGLESQKIVIR